MSVRLPPPTSAAAFTPRYSASIRWHESGTSIPEMATGTLMRRRRSDAPDFVQTDIRIEYEFQHNDSNQAAHDYDNHAVTFALVARRQGSAGRNRLPPASGLAPGMPPGVARSFRHARGRAGLSRGRPRGREFSGQWPDRRRRGLSPR